MVSSCGGFEDYLWRGINDSSDFFKFIDMEAITNQVLDSFTFDEWKIYSLKWGSFQDPCWGKYHSQWGSSPDHWARRRN